MTEVEYRKRYAPLQTAQRDFLPGRLVSLIDEKEWSHDLSEAVCRVGLSGYPLPGLERPPARWRPACPVAGGTLPVPTPTVRAPVRCRLG